MQDDPLKRFQYWEYLFTNRPGIGWLWGLAPLSGIVLDVVLAIMFVCSMNFVRRGGHFQVSINLPVKKNYVPRSPIFDKE